jgi:hypothetical protein
MLPNHQYPIPQREPLMGIVRDRCIHRSMSNRNACRRRNHPPDMLIRLVPHLDLAGDVVQVSATPHPMEMLVAECLCDRDHKIVEGVRPHIKSDVPLLTDRASKRKRPHSLTGP